MSWSWKQARKEAQGADQFWASTSVLVLANKTKPEPGLNLRTWTWTGTRFYFLKELDLEPGTQFYLDMELKPEPKLLKTTLEKKTELIVSSGLD
jgi:hypothetical protein